MTVTQDDLERWRKLANAATPEAVPDVEDALFIVAAQEALLALLAEVERLRTELRAAKMGHNHYCPGLFSGRCRCVAKAHNRRIDEALGRGQAMSSAIPDLASMTKRADSLAERLERYDQYFAGLITYEQVHAGEMTDAEKRAYEKTMSESTSHEYKRELKAMLGEAYREIERLRAVVSAARVLRRDMFGEPVTRNAAYALLDKALHELDAFDRAQAPKRVVLVIAWWVISKNMNAKQIAAIAGLVTPFAAIGGWRYWVNRKTRKKE